MVINLKEKRVIIYNIQYTIQRSFFLENIVEKDFIIILKYSKWNIHFFFFLKEILTGCPAALMCLIIFNYNEKINGVQNEIGL